MFIKSLHSQKLLADRLSSYSNLILTYVGKRLPSRLALVGQWTPDQGLNDPFMPQGRYSFSATGFIYRMQLNATKPLFKFWKHFIASPPIRCRERHVQLGKTRNLENETFVLPIQACISNLLLRYRFLLPSRYSLESYNNKEIDDRVGIHCSQNIA